MSCYRHIQPKAIVRSLKLSCGGEPALVIEKQGPTKRVATVEVVFQMHGVQTSFADAHPRSSGLQKMVSRGRCLVNTISTRKRGLEAIII
jgi:hypothetical protein